MAQRRSGISLCVVIYHLNGKFNWFGWTAAKSPEYHIQLHHRCSLIWVASWRRTSCFLDWPFSEFSFRWLWKVESRFRLQNEWESLTGSDDIFVAAHFSFAARIARPNVDQLWWLQSEKTMESRAAERARWKHINLFMGLFFAYLWNGDATSSRVGESERGREKTEQIQATLYPIWQGFSHIIL